MNELIGKEMTITKADYSQETGVVIGVNEQQTIIDLGKGISGTGKTTYITIIDANGVEHTGTLF